MTVPEQTTPSNQCKLTKTFVGVGNVCIGSECEFHVPNRCEIQSDWVKPVTLRDFAITRFPALHAVSEPVGFDITLSQCGRGQAVDQFPRQGPQPNPDTTLLQLSAPAGRPVARGFNIVMMHGQTKQRIAYGDPGTAPTYPMIRNGDTATIPLLAQYIRTGTDGELAPGSANGAAEFTFTFP